MRSAGNCRRKRFACINNAHKGETIQMFRSRYALHLIAALAATTVVSPAHAATPADSRQSSVSAEPARLARYGVWRGTIGKQDVMVKLAPTGCKSSYYYMRHLVEINLTEQDKRGQMWTETTPGNPAWKFETASADALDGRWLAADGKRSVPIHLKLMALSDGGNGSCGKLDDTFDEPRAILRKQAITDQHFGERRYRAISVLNGNVQGFEIPDDEYRLPNLNNTMHTWLHTKIADYLSCDDGSYFHEKMAPAFWDRHVLVIKETFSMYCGGAHPLDGAVYLTWNLATDKEVNVWDWIRDSKAEYGREPPLPLKSLILGMVPGGKDTGDCADVIDDSTSYLPHPDANGIVFSTDLPHVARGCDRDIEMPYAKMLPYLTPEGTAAVRALMNDHHP